MRPPGELPVDLRKGGAQAVANGFTQEARTRPRSLLFSHDQPSSPPNQRKRPIPSFSGDHQRANDLEFSPKLHFWNLEASRVRNRFSNYVLNHFFKERAPLG
jgi:hypothetical protein